MSIVAWIILGLISGFIASKIVNKRGEGILLDIVLGIAGALFGGWMFAAIGHSGVTGVNLYNIFVSVIGAIVVLVVYHALSRGSRRPV
ncbi:MAG: GlsB/YeaQ/YmgE family stress response membrane protein [Acidobacteria bacterium]|nr:MAG: GlsB/YeaQ/YmgE family stress response membrane protein [Acidobacteriota bacterium]